VVTDPHEMVKVIRKEGKRPSGAVQNQWALKKHMKAAGYLLAAGDKEGDYGFFGRDDTWKRLRTFLQTDLLAPKAAAGYVPGAIEAARLATKGAPFYKGDLHEWLHYAAFDMFCTVMFGQITDCSNPKTFTQVEHTEFASSATEFLQLNNYMNANAMEILLGRSGLYETEKHKRLKSLLDDIFARGRRFVNDFMDKEEAELTEFEKKSWLYHAMKRQAEEQTVSKEEMIELAIVGLSAAVDTTSSLIAWNILHMATNQEIQDKVYQELTTAIEESGADGLTAEILSKDKTPFFFACVREAHRVSPAAGLAMFKTCAEEIEVHGQTFDKGTMFVFEGMTTVRDKELVDKPTEFIPERWLPEAVEARKGTPKEVIDHAFFKEPFSQGARKCPGSRVAMNENLALVAQLVLDWKITAPGLNSYKDATYGLRGAISPNLPKLEFAPRS